MKPPNLKTEDVIMCCLSGGNARMKISWVNRRNSEKDLPQSHFIHHESQVKSPRNEPDALRWDASAPHLILGIENTLCPCVLFLCSDHNKRFVNQL
jgi:hypothetical protein